MTAQRSVRICLGLALWLVLAACWSRGVQANAQGRGPLTACVDPRASFMLADPQIVARHAPGWRAGMQRRGRCFTIQPGEQWERVVAVGGMVIMRRTPPQPGVPPLWFRADALPGGARPDAARNTRRTVGGPRPDVGSAPQAPTAGPGAPGPPDRTDIATETLPAPAAAGLPALRLPAPVILAPAPRLRIVPMPPLGKPAPDRTAPSAADTDTSAASARGYVVGFAIAIVLIVLLLAAFGLLLCLLLRRPSEASPGPSPEAMRPVAMHPAVERPAVERPTVLRIGQPMPGRIRVAVIKAAPRPLASALQGAAATMQPATLSPPAGAGAGPETCAVLLREAGWEVRIRPGSDRRHADVVARRADRIMAMRFLPAMIPVDEQAVEEACVARERERADLAVIVSDASCTPGARKLAARVGVGLVREDALRAFVA